MILKFFIVFISILSVLAMLSIYAAKVAYQFQYLRLKNKLKPSDFFDVFKFSLGNQKEKQLRKEAFLLFPLLFPIVLEDEKEELEIIKKRIKRLHLFIYVVIMVIMIVGVYTSKAYPNGIFN